MTVSPLERYRDELESINERRMQAVIRKTLTKLHSYRGAETGRSSSDWSASSGDADSDLQGDLATLRERSRELVRNDGLAAGAIGGFVENVVGRGFRLQAQVDHGEAGITEEQARRFNDAAERVWNRWSKRADAADRLDFNGLSSLSFRSMLESGDVFTIPLMVEEPGRDYSLAVEVVEADRVSTPIGRTEDHRLRFGVEMGSRGQPIAYHVRLGHPGDYYDSRPESWRRYERRNPKTGRPNIIHHYRPQRPGQSRGVPLLSPVLREFHDLRGYLESERVAARAAACIAMIITSMDPESHRDANVYKDGLTEELEPGVMQYLAPGEDMKSFDPSRPNSGIADYVETQARMISSGINVSYGTLTRDYSKSNFSNTRAELMGDRRGFRAWQSFWASTFHQPYYAMLMEEAFLRGELPGVPGLDLLERPDVWLRCEWLPDGWDWLDPLKDIQAAAQAIEAGLDSRNRVIKTRGGDPDEIFRDLDRENDVLAKGSAVEDEDADEPVQETEIEDADA